MKKVYFELVNGEVVKPFTSLPPYYAVVDYKLQVTEIKICFSKDNIDSRGHVWMMEQIVKAEKDWTDYKHLMKSLKRHILCNVFNSDKDNYEEELHPRFIYLTFWKK